MKYYLTERLDFVKFIQYPCFTQRSCTIDIATAEYEDMKENIDIKDIPKAFRYDDMMNDFYCYIKGEKKNPYTYEHDLAVHKVLNEICGIN